jgi:hypothetical protein
MFRYLFFVFCLFSYNSFAQNLVTTTSGVNPTCTGYEDGVVSCQAGIAGASSPVVISEVNTNSPDFMELTNVSGASVDTDGWFVITSDDYSNINDPNTLDWELPSSVAAGWIDYREDVTGSNYWGNNLYYNNTSPGWVLLSDDQGNIVDFVGWGWTATEISTTLNFSFNGFTFNITNEWTGNSVPTNSCASSFVRTGNQDNDDNTDWSCTTVSKGSLNSGLTLPFLGNVGMSYLWSTGDTTNTVDSLGAGTYYVTVTAASGPTTIDTVVLVDPDPVDFNLPSDTTICSNMAVFLDAGDWESYAWSDSSTFQIVVTSQPGVYSCTVTDTSGCFGSDSMELFAGIIPDIILEDTTVCDSLLELDAGNTGSTYSWSTSETTQVISVSTTGSYSLTVTSEDGCHEYKTVYVELFPVPTVDIGDDFTLCYNLNQTQGLTVSNSWSNIVWSDLSTGTSIIVGSGVTQSGTETIWVTVQDENGCYASDSVNVEFEECVGIESLKAGQLKLFPNPTTGVVTLKSSENLQLIELFDVAGNRIMRLETNSTMTQTIDLLNYDKGTYLINATTDRGTYQKTMILQ